MRGWRKMSSDILRDGFILESKYEVISCEIYSNVESKNTIFDLTIVDNEEDLKEKIIDIVYNDKIIDSLYCRKHSRNEWKLKTVISTNYMLEGSHKVKLYLEDFGNILDLYFDIAEENNSFVDKYLNCTFSCRQEGDSIVVNLNSNAQLPSFSFDIFCNKAIIGTYYAIVGDLIDNLLLRFALPSDIIIKSERLVTIVPKDKRLPILESVCKIEEYKFEENKIRIAIVDCSLRSAKGHMYNTVIRLADAFKDLGTNVNVFAHADFYDKDNLNIFQSIFKNSCYDVSEYGLLPYSHDGQQDFNNKSKHIDAMVEELISISSQISGKQTVIVFTTITPVMFLVISKWMAQKSNDGSQVIFGLMLESGALHVIDSRYNLSYPGMLVEEGMNFLSKRKLCDFHLWCVSEQLRLGYAGIAASFEKIEVKKCPNFFTSANKHIKSEDDRNNIILYMGEAKKDKGFRLLPGLLRAISKTPSLKKENFIVHYTGKEEPETVKIVEKNIKYLQNNGFNISLINSFLDIKSYQNLISSAKLIVVRYDRSHYWEKSSGVTWEAISLGIPIITYRNSFIANEAATYNLSSYLLDSNDNHELIDLIIKSIENKQRDISLCKEAAKLFDEDNGAERFAKITVDMIHAKLLNDFIAY